MEETNMKIAKFFEILQSEEILLDYTLQMFKDKGFILDFDLSTDSLVLNTLQTEAVV